MAKVVTALITALLITAAAVILHVESVMANPFTNSRYNGETFAPSNAPAPTISILCPENNKAYNTDSITLNFNASVEKFLEFDPSKPVVSGMQIIKSSFTADWLPNLTQIEIAPYLTEEENSNDISVSLHLTAVPDGKHVLRVYVYAEGSIIDPIKWYTFQTFGYSQVNFIVDTAPPNISVSQIGNKIHSESEPLEIPLNFTINEPATKISYVLDAMENVTIDVNTTLSGLNCGEHSLTVYAWDTAGNIGTSETLYFTIAEPLPVVPVAAASAASVAVVSLGLLVYFKKRKG
jgi:hypothetical protein